MFASLFGSAKAQPKPQADDTEVNIKKLDRDVHRIERRQKATEAKKDKAVEVAKAKMKNNDKQGALAAMKKSKLLEKELTKLDGQVVMLEQQKMALEASTTETSVMSGLK